jgi:fucose 4-O-acetylase-like acetyltransferase
MLKFDQVAADRIVWVDASKGLAIVLVVFGHVIGGMMARGWIDKAGPPRVIYDFIYLFHMPLFFLIAGAFAIDGIRRHVGQAMLSRVGSILWPYLLWGTIFIIAEPLVYSFRLDPRDETNLFESIRQLFLGETSWFLWTLFFAHCVLIVTKRIPISLVFALSVIVSVLLSTTNLGTLSSLIHYMPFMALGAAIGRQNLVALFSSRWSSAMLGACMLVALFFFVALYPDREQMAAHLAQAPVLNLFCGLIGSFAAIMLAKSYGALRLERVLSVIGAASLVVFLLHPYFQGASRALVFQILGASSWAQLAIPTFIAVAGPTLAWMSAERLGCSWLFRLDLRSYIRRMGAAYPR